VPHLKIVIFTLDDAEELRQHAFRLGALGYVSKSESPEALLTEVRKLLL
jgi:DNA-binding NarL/FixJ family response regulator